MAAPQDIEKVQQLLREFLSGNENSLGEAFNLMDKDKDGKIDFNEFRAFTGSEQETSEQQVVFQKIDKDNDGKIDINEFKEFINAKGLKECCLVF